MILMFSAVMPRASVAAAIGGKAGNLVGLDDPLLRVLRGNVGHRIQACVAFAPRGKITCSTLRRISSVSTQAPARSSPPSRHVEPPKCHAAGKAEEGQTSRRGNRPDYPFQPTVAAVDLDVDDAVPLAGNHAGSTSRVMRKAPVRLVSMIFSHKASLWPHTGCSARCRRRSTAGCRWCCNGPRRRDECPDRLAVAHIEVACENPRAMVHQFASALA